MSIFILCNGEGLVVNGKRLWNYDIVIRIQNLDFEELEKSGLLNKRKLKQIPSFFRFTSNLFF